MPTQSVIWRMKLLAQSFLHCGYGLNRNMLCSLQNSCGVLRTAYKDSADECS